MALAQSKGRESWQYHMLLPRSKGDLDHLWKMPRPSLELALPGWIGLSNSPVKLIPFIVLQYSVHPGHRELLDPKGKRVANWVARIEALSPLSYPILLCKSQSLRIFHKGNRFFGHVWSYIHSINLTLTKLLFAIKEFKKLQAVPFICFSAAWSWRKWLEAGVILGYARK